MNEKSRNKHPIFIQRHERLSVWRSIGAGMVGWNEKGEFETTDFSEQARQALKNVVTVLNEAGAQSEHITRMNWYLVDLDEYNAALKQLGKIYQEEIGKVFPAMTGIQVAGLVEKEAKLEIEVTAVIPDEDWY